MLTVTDIRKSYHDQSILAGVTFQAQPGTVTILLGPSGSGKSTLLRILNDLAYADAGHITLSGTDIDPTGPHQTRRIGMVFQSFNVFTNMSVLHNITFTLEKACSYASDRADKRARELLQEYQLTKQMDQCARSISGGQQQRLAIARTVATQPEVICLDEPTSALDPYLTDHVAQVIEQLAQASYTVIVATHDTHLIRKLTGTIHLLYHGAIQDSASTETVIQQPQKAQDIARFLGILE